MACYYIYSLESSLLIVGEENNRDFTHLLAGVS